MTDRELMQQALDALELVTDLTSHDNELYEAIDALRARLAQPELQQRTGDCLLTGVCASEGHRIQKAQPEPEPVEWNCGDPDCDVCV